MNKPTKEIPKGIYCYNRNEKGEYKYCPYSSYVTVANVRLPHCIYLGLTDLECNNDEYKTLLEHFKCTEDELLDIFDGGLLFDSCKECNVNMEIDINELL